MYPSWSSLSLSSAAVPVGKSGIAARLVDLGDDPLPELHCDSWWVEQKAGFLVATFGIAKEAKVKSLWTSRFTGLGGNRDVLFKFRKLEQRIHRPVYLSETRSTWTVCFAPGPSPLVDHGNLVLV